MARTPPDPAKLRVGDPETTEVFRRILVVHVRTFFRRESLVHDVSQDALLELLAKLDAGAEPEHPIYWALNAANNAVRRELTRQRQRTGQQSFESQLHALDEPLDPAALLDAREDLRRLAVLLSEWDESPRAALTAAAEGCDHNELGELLGVSPGAARMTLSRARAHMSSELGAAQRFAVLVSLAKQAGLLGGGR